MALTEPPLAAFNDEAPPGARARNLALGIGGVILTVIFLVAGYVILADKASPIPKPWSSASPPRTPMTS